MISPVGSCTTSKMASGLPGMSGGRMTLPLILRLDASDVIRLGARARRGVGVAPSAAARARLLALGLRLAGRRFARLRARLRFCAALLGLRASAARPSFASRFAPRASSSRLRCSRRLARLRAPSSRARLLASCGLPLPAALSARRRPRAARLLDSRLWRLGARGFGRLGRRHGLRRRLRLVGLRTARAGSARAWRRRRGSARHGCVAARRRIELGVTGSGCGSASARENDQHAMKTRVHGEREHRAPATCRRAPPDAGCATERSLGRSAPATRRRPREQADLAARRCAAARRALRARPRSARPCRPR